MQSKRMEVLANNLANVDTPNYKARDIDFKSALAAAPASPDASVKIATTSAAAPERPTRPATRRRAEVSRARSRPPSTATRSTRSRSRRRSRTTRCAIRRRSPF